MRILIAHFKKSHRFSVSLEQGTLLYVLIPKSPFGHMAFPLFLLHSGLSWRFPLKTNYRLTDKVQRVVGGRVGEEKGANSDVMKL